MATTRTKLTVGLFVIVGIALAAVAIIWLGMSNYLETGRKYVAYFDESVQGLDRDSPVKYRGVAIGRVQSVRVAPDATLIEVFFTIDSSLNPEKGMVARLKSVGITGIMFIELDRQGPREHIGPPDLSFEPEYPVVATTPSDLKLLFDGVDAVLHQLNALDARAISDKLTITVETIHEAVTGADIPQVSADFRELLNRLVTVLDADRLDRIMTLLESAASDVKTFTDTAGTALDRADRVIAQGGRDLSVALDGLKTAVDSADLFFDDGTELLSHAELRLNGVQRHLLVTLQNLEKTSENLQRFMEIIADQPSQLIFGEPVPRRRADQELYEK